LNFFPLSGCNIARTILKQKVMNETLEKIAYFLPRTGWAAPSTGPAGGLAALDIWVASDRRARAWSSRMLPGRGQGQSVAGPAMEQLFAQQGFQLTDGHRHGGLRHPPRPGCRADIAMLGRGDEVIDLSKSEWYHYFIIPIYQHHLFLMMPRIWQESGGGLKEQRNAMQIGADQIATYARDGAIVLKGAFADWVAPLREGVARNMAQPGPFGTENVRPGDGGGSFFDDYCNWHAFPNSPTSSSTRRQRNWPDS
jgi:hypothetical protein